MNPDGTPETDFEAIVLQTGLAKILVQIGSYQPQTRAQAEKIADVDVSPATDPHARAMYDQLRKNLNRDTESDQP